MVKNYVEKTGCTVDRCEKSHHVLLDLPAPAAKNNQKTLFFKKPT